METENKMITLATILACILFSIVAMLVWDTLSKVYNGYAVTLEDMLIHIASLICIMIIMYILSTY